MRQFVKASLATVVLGAALVFAGTATAGITNTKHFLGAGGTASDNEVSAGDNAEICIFCHTPHGGDTGAAVPLWNKVLSTANFQTYDSLGTSTLDAGVVDVGSVSIACLTCHDGTQAIDNILNDSGSGGYVADGGGVDGLGYTWSSTFNTLDATGTFQNSVDDVGGTNIYEIGTDLRNDHPIGVQYGGGGVKAAITDTRDTDFTTVSRIGTQNRWYVDNPLSGTKGSFDKWDFKLYTRNTSGVTSRNNVPLAGEPEPFVECGSCHDPHLETTTFLRINPADNTAGARSNSGSAVCLTCHTK
ncbi:MAG: hypothetical protein V3R49_05075 [Gammaproteobacteria bacterium]